MAYTASALSFILEDLGKTVVCMDADEVGPQLSTHEHPQIVTGAQIPLSQLRNDAVDNLLGALVLAGYYIIPGIVLHVVTILPCPANCRDQNVVSTSITRYTEATECPSSHHMTSMPSQARTSLPSSTVCPAMT